MLDALIPAARALKQSAERGESARSAWMDAASAAAEGADATASMKPRTRSGELSGRPSDRRPGRGRQGGRDMAERRRVDGGVSDVRSTIARPCTPMPLMGHP